MAADTAIDDEMSPAERRRLKVRDAIIGAAEEIFAEEGLPGLSMRRIAERIDYSPAALYKYFDSKEALFTEIREQFFERLLMRMRAACDAVEEGPKLCGACMRAYVETGLEQPAHYRLAFSAGTPEEHMQPDDHVKEGTYAFAAAEHLHKMIEESMDDGWFRKVDLAMAANSVWASSHGLTMLAVTVPEFPKEMPGRGDISLDAMIDFHAETVMRGFATDRLLARLDAAAPKAR